MPRNYLHTRMIHVAEFLEDANFKFGLEKNRCNFIKVLKHYTFKDNKKYTWCHKSGTAFLYLHVNIIFLLLSLPRTYRTFHLKNRNKGFFPIQPKVIEKIRKFLIFILIIQINFWNFIGIWLTAANMEDEGVDQEDVQVV